MSLSATTLKLSSAASSAVANGRLALEKKADFMRD